MDASGRTAPDQDAVFRSAWVSRLPNRRSVGNIPKPHPTTDSGQSGHESQEQFDWENRFQDLLYRRADEEALLLRSFRRNITRLSSAATEFHPLILISGPCGTGKTCLARTLQKSVEGAGGYFSIGKFDSLERSEPFRSWISVFTTLTESIVSRGKDAQDQFRQNVFKALGHELGVLTDLVPAIRDVFDDFTNDTLPHTSGDALRRFAYVMREFLRAVCSREHPVVIVLDDLHYADACSWFLLHSLVSCEDLVFVGTCLDSVSPCSTLSINLRKIENEYGSEAICNIAMRNLDGDTLKQIISESFQLPIDRCRAFSDIIIGQTDGNLPHVMAFMNWLDDKGFLRRVRGEWNLDEEATISAIECSCVEIFLSNKLSRLPEDIKQIIRIASCLGSAIKRPVLDALLNKDHYQCLLSASNKRALIIQNEEYKFLSDGQRKAAYSLIPKSDRVGFHLNLGRRLLSAFDDSEIDDHLFTILGQFKEGGDLITDPQERHNVCQLCLQAGRRAASRSAFTAASEYLKFGVSLLCKERKWKEQNDLRLALYNISAEVEVIRSDFDLVDKLLDEVLSVNFNRIDDKMQAYCTKIFSLSLRDRHQEAIDTGIKALSMIGESSPRRLGFFQLTMELLRVEKKLRGKTDEMIMTLPRMWCHRKIMAMQILNTMTLDSMFSRPELSPFVVLKMMSLTLAHGLNEHASVAFSTFGMILVSLKGDIDEGCRHGRLSLKLLSLFRFDAYLPRTYCAVYGVLHSYKQPLVSTLDPLMHAHRVGLLTGDLEFAALSANLYSRAKFWSGGLLSQVEMDVLHHSAWMQAQKNESAMTLAAPFLNFLRVLQGMKDPFDYTVLDKLLEHATRSGNQLGQYVILDQKLIISYLFGKPHQGVESIANESQGIPVDISVYLRMTFKGMVFLALARENVKRRKYIRQTRGLIKALKKVSRKAPYNFCCMLFLLQGELASLLGKFDEGNQKLSCAVGMASSAGLAMFHALALERLGWHTFWQRNPDVDLAESYFSKSCDVYSKWGAIAKSDHLRAQVTLLLSPAKNGSSILE